MPHLQVTLPTRVEDLPDHISEPSIRFAVGGGGHTFLLTAQGRLFGAGWNASGQVQRGRERVKMIDKQTLPALVT